MSGHSATKTLSNITNAVLVWPWPEQMCHSTDQTQVRLQKRGRSGCLAQRSRASGKDEDRGVGQLGGAGEMVQTLKSPEGHVRLRILLKRRRVGSEPRRASPVPGSELSVTP